MDFKDKQNLFHMLAGCFLGGKTYSEYTYFLLSALVEAGDIAQKENLKLAKGYKTLVSLTAENHQRAEKHLKMIENFLKAEPSTHALALQEVDRIEEVISLMLQLSPRGQLRVKGLIERIRKDADEIEYWQQIQNDLAYEPS